MKLLIKQRVFSWTDTYDVFDENQNIKYFVRSQFLSLGHQIHVYDKLTGNEIGTIRQKLFAFTPQFNIEINGEVVGTVVKKISLFRPRYIVDFMGWDVDGDFMGWDYSVIENNFKVMHISKELFHWGDTYVIDYANPGHELMGLLLVIAIDAANCSNDK